MEKRSGFLPADILIPQGIAMEKWSVVACDQYTSQPDYWKAVQSIVEGAPSSYYITYPEVYLSEGRQEERIASINAGMQKYLREDLFCCYENSMVYVERELGGGRIRRGLVGMIDLMEYDYHIGAQAKIRATEKTVLERIPPRVKIREDAPLELPHVMLLIDDEDRTVIEPVEAKKTAQNKLYDFELMQGGGRIRGYLLDENELDRIEAALLALCSETRFAEKYQVSGQKPIVYAVGDGNHSLASAKECFEREKAGLPEDQWKDLKSRYALVELVNIHDTSLEFEPIHRVVFGCSLEEMEQAFVKYYPDAQKKQEEGNSIVFLQDDARSAWYVPSQEKRLTVAVLQEFLDVFAKDKNCAVDYIHGSDVVSQLASSGENVGILLPDVGKSELFRTVILDGALPRKTFSMGHAHEKRFYLEARRIK